MRNDVFTVVKRGVVMLLIDLKSCRIDECEEVDEKIKMPYAVIVSRDRRENVVDFDREIISAHDIDFLDVVDEKTGEKIKKVNEKSEANEVSEINEAGFFVCFVRT